MAHQEHHEGPGGHKGGAKVKSASEWAQSQNESAKLAALNSNGSHTFLPMGAWKLSMRVPRISWAKYWFKVRTRSLVLCHSNCSLTHCKGYLLGLNLKRHCVAGIAEACLAVTKRENSDRDSTARPLAVLNLVGTLRLS